MRRGGGFRGGGRRTGGARSRGQIRHGKSVQYAIKSSRGKTKYIGVSNNPTRRAAEHRKSGKMRGGDKLVVQSRALSRPKAERLESGRLKGYRDSHGGRNPRHNTTKSGQYQQRLF